MDKRRIAEIYLQEDNNCAETLLRAASEAYGLDLSPEDTRLIAAFGGGMGCGGTCGALAGALAVLGRVAIEGRAHATPGFRERCAALVQRFERELGSRECDAIKARHFKDDGTRCLHTVCAAADLLDDFLLELRGGQAETSQETSAQAAPAAQAAPEAQGEIPADADIARVKGRGFLHNKGTDRFNGRVITRAGRLTAEQLACIADAAGRFGNGNVALTTRLTVEVMGIPYAQIEPFCAALSAQGLKTGGTGSRVRPVVSCKGTTCRFGLIDTYALSDKLHEMFYEGWYDVTLPHKFKIAVGGCPNNCVKPDLNDLGIVGARAPRFEQDACRGCKKCGLEAACPTGAVQRVDGRIRIDSEKCNSCGRCVGKCVFRLNDAAQGGYRVFIGGRWGRAGVRGRELSRVLCSEREVLDAVRSALLLFRAYGNKGERFADTVTRIGFEEADRLILSGELLAREREILSLDVVGGASC